MYFIFDIHDSLFIYLIFIFGFSNNELCDTNFIKIIMIFISIPFYPAVVLSKL